MRSSDSPAAEKDKKEILTQSKVLDSNRKDTEKPAICVSACTLAEAEFDLLIFAILGVTNEPCATNDEVAS